MFERERVSQTVNVINGVFVQFIPSLVRHADAESKSDGVACLNCYSRESMVAAGMDEVVLL